MTTGLAQSHAAERVASFDFGSLDTLDELGLGEHVVALPKQGLPTYLEHYADEAYRDVGGLRSPDFDALRDAEPSLILFTGRQNEWREEFEEIAEVMDTGLGGDDYLVTFEENVTRLAERFDAGEAAAESLQMLHEHVDSARQRLADVPLTLVATHNQGNLMLNTHPVVYDVLDLSQPTIPESVPSETRGNRTFTPLSSEAIAEIAPATLLIVDRSAAIGDEAIELDALRGELARVGADDINVVVLTPELWYLSGGGLQSLMLQIDEVAAALER
ncbi:ABC transporter substrate-binding protein [Billgrantia endophytica]|uniref:ABC transporter substrate-binding protein n=2 Tax=Billgrantia endophytica TaxID=2033802 RepID=A0A2N7U311_9GAMM|nr:ABC transporter substrate-binding protein [Halomonas endophytica]